MMARAPCSSLFVWGSDKGRKREVTGAAAGSSQSVNASSTSKEEDGGRRRVIKYGPSDQGRRERRKERGASGAVIRGEKKGDTSGVKNGRGLNEKSTQMD